MAKFCEASTIGHLEEMKFFLKYQNRRGRYKALLPSLSSPSYSFDRVVDAMELAQYKETEVYTKLVSLHDVASKYGDGEVSF